MQNLFTFYMKAHKLQWQCFTFATQQEKKQVRQSLSYLRYLIFKSVPDQLRPKVLAKLDIDRLNQIRLSFGLKKELSPPPRTMWNDLSSLTPRKKNRKPNQRKPTSRRRAKKPKFLKTPARKKSKKNRKKQRKSQKARKKVESPVYVTWKPPKNEGALGGWRE